MSRPAGATTCITWNPEASSPDSKTTNLRSSNWTHQTSPRCTPGKRADLLVLNTDPTTDVRNLRELRLVILNGELAVDKS
jgi:hypothetical protein